MKFLKDFALISAVSVLSFGVSPPAQASNLFANSGIRFDKDTTVNFEFLKSQGIYKSDFGVQQAGGSFISLLKETQNADIQHTNVNDWQGTCGISVLQCFASFTFQAQTDYKLVLQSYEKIQIDTTKWGYRSTPDKIVDSSSPVSTVFTPNSETSYTLAWDDGFVGDRDTNDFFVKASWQEAPSVSVPEPRTLLGLGLLAGFLTLQGSKRIGFKSQED
ncbi:PEP-CTERM sorting domain-containing protein [Ancylothrix sp. C2]|uniref:PEP-CTERM sorting domain-containing protein n=1 Tax=Ancylothrix sp. D3o TaxID=2953691 RepID=UPI0021BA8942|nr:PEP-CTERM sorting domain-containing protein [Ancylothrix sp. D3o]MCT7950775.1 PEP-CTERM sorting domain-containing protein [Ancylothrix sp. D3o]